MTLQQFQGVVAFAVRNNKTAIVSRLNQLGYSTPMNISDVDLYDKLIGIFSASGLDEINIIFAGVPIDYTKITPEEAQRVFIEVGGIQPVAQKGQVTQSLTDYLDVIQKFFAGQKVEVGASSSTTSSPALSPLAVIGIAVAALVVIIIIVLSPRLAK